MTDGNDLTDAAQQAVDAAPKPVNPQNLGSDVVVANEGVVSDAQAATTLVKPEDTHIDHYETPADPDLRVEAVVPQADIDTTSPLAPKTHDPLHHEPPVPGRPDLEEENPAKPPLTPKLTSTSDFPADKKD